MRWSALFLLYMVACGCAVTSAQAKGPPKRSTSLISLNSSFRDLSAQVAPAVVQILSTGYAPIPAGGGHILAKRRSTGSGVIVSNEGYILTNAHVVQGANRVQVRLPRKSLARGRSILKPEGEVRSAKLVGLDLETDLALLKIEATSLATAKFGKSERLTTGELVLAFGAPFGLEGTVTMGVVSAVARQRHPDDNMIYIQTDAPINPGNSGGPLINTRGEIVGINTFILSPSGASSGLGFAVPSNIAETVYQQLKKQGRVRRGVIGAITQSITPLLARGLGLDFDNGVIVADVYPRGPAASAGLEVGDVILALDGKRMENARQFDVNVYHRPIGGTVNVGILRGGEQQQLEIPVVERPMVLTSMATEADPSENLVNRLGILGTDLTDRVKTMIPRLRVDSGVLIIATNPGESTGALRVGDVIHAVNGSEVEDLEALKGQLDAINDDGAVVLQIERRGVLRYVPLSAD